MKVIVSILIIGFISKATAAEKEDYQNRLLTADKVNLLVKEQLDRGVPDSKTLREGINEELIRLDLIMQEARNSGFDKQPLTKLHAELASQGSIAKDYLQEWIKNHPITEDMMKKEYSEWISNMGNTEYLLRDILVKSEEEAKGVIARLKENEKFEIIASKQTLDIRSRARGGLQDWVGVGFLDKAIASSVSKLPRGKWTTEPVKAANGWHILLLEDSKPFVASSFESVKPQIKQNLEQKSIKAYIDGLRAMKKK